MNKNIDINAKASAYYYEYDEYDHEIAYKEKTDFHIAIEQGYLEIVKFQAEQSNIDINIRLIVRKRGISLKKQIENYHIEKNEKNKKTNPKYEEYRYEYSDYYDSSVSDANITLVQRFFKSN